MTSSKKMDSGKFSGGRSSFTQTCTLLSQYLKEKGSFGDLSLGLTPKSSESKETATVNFLPMIENSGRISGSGDVSVDNLPHLVGEEEALNKSDGGQRPDKQTGQMTIFYAGQVLVFDDLPADKAKEIMTLAGKSFAPPHTAHSGVNSAAAGAATAVAPFGQPERAVHVPHPALANDLPIARKHSLARFLEKRKDRITANAPYQVTKPAQPNPVKTEPWLGLAPQLPVQAQRH